MPTGHESWIGNTDQILFSTKDPDGHPNLWTAGTDDEVPTPVPCAGKRYCHVSVSEGGTYWVGDVHTEEGVPIYIGRFESGTCRHAVLSRTVLSREQWSHAHPYLTADNKWLIFTSTRTGLAQVYGARLPDGWLEEL
jgi:hypothetical protein